MKRSVRAWLLCAGVLFAGMLGLGAASGAIARPSPATSISRASAVARSQRIATRLDGVLSAVNALKIPGYVVGVTGGEVGRYERAVGLAAPKQPMELTDHFRIGSISKTFTATVILELVDRGLLHLDDPIVRWERNVPDASRITIRMLLNMTSGIWDEGGTGPNGQRSSLSNWIVQNCFTPPAKNCGQYWTPQQIVDLAIQDSKNLTHGPAYAPGVWYYSDTNYAILGIIAQKVTHQPFSALLKRFVFNPLHLRQTSFPTHSSTIPSPATEGYFPVYNMANQLKGYGPGPTPSPSALFGAGNIVSTLGDLQIWARAMATGVLLKPRTQRLRLQLVPTGGQFPPLANSGAGVALSTGYGLGLADAGNLIGHNGEFAPPGYTAEMWYLPRVHGTVVVLLNSVTICTSPLGTALLSDATNVSLAQQAFGQALGRVAPPAPATCPVPLSGAAGVG